MRSDPDDEERDGPWNVFNFLLSDMSDSPRRFYHKNIMLICFVRNLMGVYEPLQISFRKLSGMDQQLTLF